MERPIDLEAFLQAVGDAVIAVNREGRLVLWNPGAERLFGHSAAEALGESLDLIIPEKSRAAHWQGFHEVMRSGRTRLGPNLLRVPAPAGTATRSALL